MQKTKIIIAIVLALLIFGYIAGNIFGFGMMVPQASEEENNYIKFFENKYPKLYVDYSPPEGGNKTKYQEIIIMNNIGTIFDTTTVTKKELSDEFFKSFIKVYTFKELVDSFRIQVENDKTIFCYKVLK